MPDEETTQPEEQPQQDGGVAAMFAPEDRRFLTNGLALGPKDEGGFRELTFPIAPMKQMTFVLAPPHQEFLLKQLSGGIDVADLTDLADAVAQEQPDE